MTGDRGVEMVSIIVPIYNVAEYLPQCIESIIAQTYKKLEIILVDDGSTDGSGEICDKYAQTDERIKVIHKENGGLVSARKAGLKAAKGEYISYVDGDDWIDHGMYGKLLGMNQTADIIAFAAYEEYGDGERTGLKKNTVEEGIYEDERDRYRLYSRMMVNGNFFENGILTFLWAKLIKRTLLLECQMNVPDIVSYAEDAACVYPCLLRADSIYVSNEPFYHYRVRPNSMVKGKVEKDKIRSLLQVLADAFFAHPVKESLRQQLVYFMQHTMLLKAYSQIEGKMTLFPFKKVKQGMKVAVYGAGIFGKVIWNYCEGSGSMEAVGWFDQRYKYYAAQGLPVQSTDNISETNFHMLVIAIVNIRLAEQIEEDLVSRGIPRDRIDRIYVEDLQEMALPYYMKEILGERKNNIYIVGAHSRGRTFCEYMTRLYPETTVESYLVDDITENQAEIDGIPVNEIGGDFRLNADYPVYIATRGVYHAKITDKLRALGMNCIYPVDVALDTRLRNEYVRKVYEDNKKEFCILDECGLNECDLKEDINTCIYVVKSAMDKKLQTNYVLLPEEQIIQAGAALTEKRLENAVCYDNVGDSISEKNRQYCELTALYWIWKNAKEDVVGMVHYRRHFLLPERWQERMLHNGIDVILPVPLYVDPSIEENYKGRHIASDWDYMMRYLKEHQPYDYESAKEFFSGNLYSPCNMFIIKKKVLDELCTWLFPILDAVVLHGGTKEDTYLNRYPGFLSERLITYFFESHRDRYRVAYANKNFLS